MNNTLNRLYKLQRRDKLKRWALIPLCLISVAILLQFSGRVFAAEVIGGSENYRLASTEVLQGDLYVTAGEIFIDGTIDGDLVAAGGYIEINGTVTGDVIAAGAGILLNGTVKDDFRAAGGGISIPGEIGGDLFVAAGGTPFDANIRAFMGDESALGQIDIAQGIRVTGSVGEDAYIFGGRGSIAGNIGGDLFSTMATVAFSGNVVGNATLRGETIEINDEGRVGGELFYTAEQEIMVDESVSPTVQFEPDGPVDAAGNPVVEIDNSPSFFSLFLSWIWQTIMTIIGLSLLTWLLLRYAPDLVPGTAEAIDEDFSRTVVYGLGFSVLMIPLAALFVFLVTLFFGGFQGGIPTFMSSFGVLSLLWILSPIFTGFWLGQEIADAVEFDLDEGIDSFRELMIATVAGIIVIVMVTRILALIPCVGGLASWVVYLLSFTMAVGGFIRWQQQERLERAATPSIPSI